MHRCRKVETGDVQEAPTPWSDSLVSDLYQKPTATTETVTVTAVNAMGTVYTFAVQVVAHSRYTVDMVATVIQHMYHPTDGYKGYEISLAAQSSGGAFVVERPMYWNASGTQGGSDVIGYIGG